MGFYLSQDSGRDFFCFFLFYLFIVSLKSLNKIKSQFFMFVDLVENRRVNLTKEVSV